MAAIEKYHVFLCGFCQLRSVLLNYFNTCQQISGVVYMCVCMHVCVGRCVSEVSSFSALLKDIIECVRVHTC